MNNEKTKIVERYVKASNENDTDKFIACFAETATVMDEGKNITGHEAIKSWFVKTRNTYEFDTEPQEMREEGNTLVMKAKVSGNFPGSPVLLDYYFTLRSGLIDDLKIS